MSNREKCIALIDSFSDSQLENIAAMLQAVRNAIEEAADEAYCVSLYKKYEANPDKGDTVTIEDAAKMLGVEL